MVLIGERLLGDRQTEGLPKGSVLETHAFSPLSHGGWILGRIKLTKDTIWGSAPGLPENQCLQLWGHGRAWGATSTRRHPQLSSRVPMDASGASMSLHETPPLRACCLQPRLF